MPHTVCKCGIKNLAKKEVVKSLNTVFSGTDSIFTFQGLDFTTLRN